MQHRKSGDGAVEVFARFNRGVRPEFWLGRLVWFDLLQYV